MKNYSKGKSTLIGEIPEKCEFKKISDFVGSYNPGELKILGYLKTHSELYDKDSYNLFIERGKEKFFLGVPAWYGKKLESDFKESGETPETFFGGASVQNIETFKTKFGNDSYNIIIFE